jgi:hypothetical protein
MTKQWLRMKIRDSKDRKTPDLRTLVEKRINGIPGIEVRQVVIAHTKRSTKSVATSPGV